MDPQKDIDDLQNELLVKILELMPLKNAVMTSGYSKKWQNMWKDMSSINISLDRYPNEDIFQPIRIYNEQPLQGFDASVTAILLNPRPVKTLRICFSFNDADIANAGVPYVRNWMEQVINRGGVEIFDVSCITLDAMLDAGVFDPIMLPVELLRSNTLVELKLCGISIDNFELPNLPMLKSVVFSHCNFENCNCFISLLNMSPNLSQLMSFATSFITEQNQLPATDILFPSLRIAELPQTFCHLPMYAFRNVQHFEIELNQVCNMEDPFPLFQHITKLSVSSVMSNWNLLFRFLNGCPNLRTLELDEGMDSDQRDFVSSGWVDPEDVPSCISHKLQYCKFNCFLGEDGELGLAIFLLRHGVLKVMDIHCRKDTQVGDLFTYKRAECELTITRDWWVTEEEDEDEDE